MTAIKHLYVLWDTPNIAVAIVVVAAAANNIFFLSQNIWKESQKDVSSVVGCQKVQK